VTNPLFQGNLAAFCGFYLTEARVGHLLDVGAKQAFMINNVRA
jgi:hypothetical protein